MSRDAVVNVTALVTLNKTDLTEQVASIGTGLMGEVDRRLRQALTL